MEDGQFELDEKTAAELDPLDVGLDAAIKAGNEAEYHTLLAQMVERVHATGRPLDPSALMPSDLVLPPADSSLEEARTLLTSDAPDHS